jgi:pyruvate/2-oxoglutarate dehydrogenase complex dihydrolipoamide dehydrogenase (E3) component
LSEKYDLVVIGGGTAGLVSAAGGASLGAKVAIVERDKLGGDCLYTGCVPTKALVKSARVAKLVETSEDFGIKSGGMEVDFPAVMARMRNIIKTAGEADDPDRFRSLGVDVFLGDEASFVSSEEINVDGRRLRAASSIVATGSHATAPPVSGLEEVGYLTNVGALSLEKLPDSMVIIGSGPIGCEFAQIFARFGCDVAMMDMVEKPLAKEDPEIRDEMLRCLEADGISFHGGFTAEAARMEGGEKVLSATNGRGEKTEVRAGEILVAAGRAPSAGSLALENAGVSIEKTGIPVDELMRTSAPNIYAAGDITGKLLFTHVAEYQARIALRNALFPIKTRADYRVVPWTTFTDPEVARVGMTEDEAREAHGSGVKVFRKEFSDVDRAMADGETAGLAKIVTTGRGKILGGHIIGPDAGNLIHEVVLAMKKNIPIQTLSQTIHVYPTLAQINQRVADEYYREKLFSGPATKAFSAFFSARRMVRERRGS